MAFYEDRVLPHLINFACSTKPTRKQREKIVHLAEGDVLEIGFGSGLNLPYYDSGKVRKIFGLEPSEGMRRKAQPNVDAAGLDVEFIDLPGEEIPLNDNSIDSVLVTYTLCTIEDPVSALRGDGIEQLRRELREHLIGTGTLEAPVITNARHARSLERAAESLAQAWAALGQGLSEEMVVEDLRLAMRRFRPVQPGQVGLRAGPARRSRFQRHQSVFPSPGWFRQVAPR